jgi:hypothetical protein
MVTTNYLAGNLTSSPYSNSTFLNEHYTDDIYTFTTTETSSINLSLHHISDGDDADLLLFADSNSNGVFDAQIDQQIQYSNLWGNSDDSINYLASAGTYFAQVVTYSLGNDGRLDYELDISATSDYPYAADTQPPNLLPLEVDGGVLSHGDVFTYSDWVGNTDTSDIYKFSLASASDVTINLTGLSNDADIRLIQDFNNNDIVDSGEVQLGFTSNNGGSSSENISFFLHGGIPFYVQVYQYNGDTSYQLQVDVA